MDRRVMIFAGEASGDMYGGLLAGALRGSDPGLRLSGIGGDAMAAAGVDLTVHIRELSVMGIWEVLRDLRRLRKVLEKAKSAMKAQKPDGLVLIDFYRFNIELAREAKKLGIPVVYYVAPKLWAWGKGRIVEMDSLVARVLAIFPFEEEFYRSHGVPVTYVGNPLMELLAATDAGPLREELALAEDETVISLLPGSRNPEVRMLLPVFLEASALLSRDLGGKVRILVPRAHTIPRAEMERMIDQSGVKATIIDGRSREALVLSDLALVASGTATLEAFLLGVPQVVAYRMARLTYHIAKRLFKLPRFSLPNIVAGREVVTELLQDEVTPERLAATALNLIGNEEARRDYLAAGVEMKKVLKGEEASRLAAGQCAAVFGFDDGQADGDQAL
ncbi:MAG: lipid-A-disaccharide synthase [bacterium]|nr:lipid-A-disaccharide synthase [bacterium]